MADRGDRPTGFERLEALLAGADERRRRVVDEPVLDKEAHVRPADVEEEAIGGRVYTCQRCARSFWGKRRGRRRLPYCDSCGRDRRNARRRKRRAERRQAA